MRLVLLVLAMALGLVAPAPAQERVVNVYNWTDYIDPAVLERFTKETGIRVQYDVYDSLETLEGKLLAGRSGYDLVVPTSEPTFSRLIAAKALQPLDRAKIPNLRNLDPTLMKRVESSDPGNRFGAIYLWGTIGLGMVPDMIKPLAADAPLDSWDLLLKPENAKRIAPCGITVMDSAIDTIPSVLRYLGRNPESTDAKDLAEVEKTLMAIRPYIRTFVSGGAVEALAGNQVCLSMTYSGDVIQAAGRAAEAKQKPVVYVAPKEFAQLSFDMLAVPADAPHPAEATALIDFLLRPDVMAAITNRTHYANAVPASLPMVDAAIRDDPNVFPPAAAMSRFFTVKAPPQSADRARTRMWARFKAGK
jgi:putrescine transport system substrate-binding protein